MIFDFNSANHTVHRNTYLSTLRFYCLIGTRPMVDHFHEQVIAKGKIVGQARTMVVTASIPRCIEYYFAINKCLANRHSPYKAIKIESFSPTKT